MKIETTDDSMIVNGKEVKFFSDRNPLNCPWKDWGVDLVLESTGVFNTDEKASMHIQAGAKKVILTRSWQRSQGGNLRCWCERRPVPP